MKKAFVSKRIVAPGGTQPGALVVEGETILGINDQAPADAEVIETEHVILPGLVDCHVHINEPGRTEWEGFVTATQAAAAGGVTTVVDMPLNCIPVTTSDQALHIKLAEAKGKLYVDTGFWGGVVPGNAEELPKLANSGVLGCKAFLCHSGIDDFPNATEADLRRAMPLLRDAGIPLLAHAELDLGHAPCPAGATSHDAWLASRPNEWEDKAIELLIALCRETRCPVHIVHLASASAVPMIRAAKAEGLPFSAETCPHYLCLSSEDVPEGDTSYKCAPPIRDLENQEGLWRALEEGVVDFVISDHSPCTPHLKKLDEGDFGNAWGGISSLSLGLMSIWTRASERGHSLDTLAKWMCHAPSVFAGVSKTKGSLEAGKRADFVLFDPDAEQTLEEEHLFFRHRVSPYLGKKVRGKIHATFLGGEQIFDVAADAPFGEGAKGRALLHRE